MKAATEAYLARIESSAGRPFTFRGDVALLVELGASDPRSYEELLFLSKFARQASAILGRGRGEEKDRLWKEFTSVMEKITAILAALTAGAPEEVRSDFARRFLAQGINEFADLTKLLHDLARLQDDAVDGRPRGNGHD